MWWFSAERLRFKKSCKAKLLEQALNEIEIKITVILSFWINLLWIISIPPLPLQRALSENNQINVHKDLKNLRTEHNNLRTTELIINKQEMHMHMQKSATHSFWQADLHPITITHIQAHTVYTDTHNLQA